MVNLTHIEQPSFFLHVSFKFYIAVSNVCEACFQLSLHIEIQTACVLECGPVWKFLSVHISCCCQDTNDFVWKDIRWNWRCTTITDLKSAYHNIYCALCTCHDCCKVTDKWLVMAHMQSDFMIRIMTNIKTLQLFYYFILVSWISHAYFSCNLFLHFNGLVEIR